MKSWRHWMGTLAIVGGVGFIGGALAFSEEAKIALDKLPKMVIDAIKAKFPAAEMVEAESEKDDGRTVYEVELKVKGQKTSVKVAANGGILEIEKEIAVKDLPKLVSEAIAAKHKGAKITSAEEVTEVKYEVMIETADGKKLEVAMDASGVVEEDEKEDKDHDDKK